MTKNWKKQKGKNNSQLHKSIRKVVNAMRPKPEIKYHFVSDNSGTLIPTTLSATLGTVVQPTAQGFDHDNYESTLSGPGAVIGLQYIAKYIQFNGFMYNDDASSHFCRIIIVRDDQPNNNDLYLYNTGSNYMDCILVENSITSLYTVNEPRRFKVLYDRTFHFEQIGFQSIRKFESHIDLHNTKISNTVNIGTANTISPLNHAYKLYAIADTPNIHLNYTLKFAFTDV